MGFSLFLWHRPGHGWKTKFWWDYNEATRPSIVSNAASAWSRFELFNRLEWFSKSHIFLKAFDCFHWNHDFSLMMSPKMCHRKTTWKHVSQLILILKFSSNSINKNHEIFKNRLQKRSKIKHKLIINSEYFCKSTSKFIK